MISMKMSASWEVEKSSSSVVRRLCHIQIGQIILDRPVDVGENSTNGVYVALRMRGNTRRILRSPEICLVIPKFPATTTPNGPGSGGYVLVDLNCTIQYSHILKMESNILQILLQKRKKYKNTTVNLGFKTLAYSNINLSQVLQRRIEHRFLNMYPDPKCMGPPIARIDVLCLSTLPWERDLINSGTKGGSESDGCPDDGCLLQTDVFSDDAEGEEDSDSDDDEVVDMEAVVVATSATRHGRRRGGGEEGSRGVSSHSAVAVSGSDTQRVNGSGGQKKVLKSMSVGQIKQKVVSLLKRLKLADPNEEIDTGTTLHLWEEIDKIEAVSDVDEDSDLDTGGTGESGSLQSVARPSIRPFFGHTGSSEETLSLDAGARLLRRLQKEALLSTEPPELPSARHIPPLQAAHDLYHESANTAGDSVPRRNPSSNTTAAATGGGGGSRGGSGVKFPTRFGQIKTRRTVPTGKRRQFVPPSPPVTAAPATAAAMVVPVVQDPLYLFGHQESVAGSLTLNCTFASDTTEDSIGGFEKMEEYSGSIENVEIPKLPASLFDVQFVVNNLEPGGKVAAEALVQAGSTKVARVSSFAEVRAVLTSLVSWAALQQQNSQQRRWGAFVSSPSSSATVSEEGGGETVRVCVVGGDALVNAVLRAFVSVAGARSEAIAASFRFLLVPVAGLHRHLTASPQPPLRHHRRSSSSTLPPLSPVASDAQRLQYPGSPSAARDVSNSTAAVPPRASLSNLIARRLCSLDPRYACLFGRLATGETVCDTSGQEAGGAAVAAAEFVRRVITYLTAADCLLPLPIGECLVAGVRASGSAVLPATGAICSAPAGSLTSSAYNPPLPMGSTSVDGGSNLEEESSKQTLVPFLLCIRLGSEAILRSCIAADALDKVAGPTDPVAGGGGGGGGDYHPPGAPHFVARTPGVCFSSLSSTAPPLLALPTPGYDRPTYELQLEYWGANAPSSSACSGVTGGFVGGASSCAWGTDGGQSALVQSASLDERAGSGFCGATDGKTSASRPVTFKVACRSMVVGLMPCGGTNNANAGASVMPFSSQLHKPSALLSLALVTKEKKPKIMRLSKRAGKELALKSEVTEGVTRLICTCKSFAASSHTAPDVDFDVTMPLSSPPLASSSAAAVACATSSFVEPGGAVSRHHGPAFRDDLACGLGGGSSDKNAPSSSSSDHVFVRRFRSFSRTSSKRFQLNRQNSLDSQPAEFSSISIDGVDWQTSRFFQVAPGWRTHVKVFPLLCLSPPPVPFALPLAKVMTLGASMVTTVAAGVPLGIPSTPPPATPPHFSSTGVPATNQTSAIAPS